MIVADNDARDGLDQSDVRGVEAQTAFVDGRPEEDGEGLEEGRHARPEERVRRWTAGRVLESTRV